MLNKTLLGEIEKGLPSPLYYIWSEESCFLEDALSRFVEVVISSHPPVPVLTRISTMKLGSYQYVPATVVPIGAVACTK